MSYSDEMLKPLNPSSSNARIGYFFDSFGEHINSHMENWIEMKKSGIAKMPDQYRAEVTLEEDFRINNEIVPLVLDFYVDPGKGENITSAIINAHVPWRNIADYIEDKKYTFSIDSVNKILYMSERGRYPITAEEGQLAMEFLDEGTVNGKLPGSTLLSDGLLLACGPEDSIELGYCPRKIGGMQPFVSLSINPFKNDLEPLRRETLSLIGGLTIH